MAIIKLGAIVTKISGKLGGSVFGQGKSGSFIRSNAYTTNKKTPKQRLQQNKIASLSTSWSQVSPSERQNWQDQTINYPYTSKVGDTVFYTNYQLFLKLNANLIIIKEPIIKVAPPFIAITAPVITALDIAASFFFVTLNGVLATTDVAIYASKSLPPSTSDVRNELRVIAVSNVRAPIQILDLIAPYMKVFGIPKGNQRIFVAVKAINFSTGTSTAITNLTSTIVESATPGIGQQIIGDTNVIA